MPDVPIAPRPGRAGESCAGCGSPLAADQRYCLECGQRRGEPRVDYRAEMARADAGEAAAKPGAPAPSPAGDEDSERAGAKSGRERDFAPLAAVGGIAVLGLMLLVGVLIGKGNTTASAPAAPQVVRVTGEGGDGESGGEGGASAGAAQKNTVAGAKKGKRAGGSGGGGADKEVVEASTDELEELASESGEDAAKKALELPDKIATPGAPPPIDKSKPPGGGEGGGVTIK